MVEAKSNAWQNALLALLFQNTAAANIGNTGGLQPSTVAGSLFISLHTADPTTSGNQSSSEASYGTGGGAYARQAVARSSGGWTISGSSPTSVTNASAITFPTCNSGTSTVTFVGIGTASTGTGELLYVGALTSSLAISTGITPSFAASALVVTEN